MSLWEWVGLIGLGFWLPVAVIFTLVERSRIIRLGGVSYRDRELDEVRRQLDVMKRDVEGEQARIQEFVSIALRDIPASAPRVELNAAVSPSVTVADGPAEFRIVRELAHSLKTPIAGVESTLRTHRPDGPDPEVGEGDWRDLLTSVELCKAVIAAFREVTRVSSEADAWAPDSVAEMISSAHEVYRKAMGRHTMLRVELPDVVSGYSSNLIVAALLPLLENAVEASPDGAEIVISSRNEPGEVRLRVHNEIDPQYGVDGHRRGPLTHDGLGLATVDRLIEDGAEGHFSHTENAGGFTAEISLPQRRVHQDD